jgi:hypothetical protein
MSIESRKNPNAKWQQIVENCLKEDVLLQELLKRAKQVPEDQREAGYIGDIEKSIFDNTEALMQAQAKLKID